jgi:hypothetical protein
MAGLLQKLFGREPEPPDVLAELSQQPEFNAQFLNQIILRGVWIITTHRAEIGAAHLQDAQEKLQGVADQLAAARADEAEIETFEEDGVCVFPIFSSAARVNEFLRTTPARTTTAYASMLIQAETLLACDLAAAKVVMNPKTSWRRLMSAEDFVALKTMCGVK